MRCEINVKRFLLLLFFVTCPFSEAVTAKHPFIVFITRIIDLAKCFTLDAATDATLTIYPGLGPKLKKYWLELHSGSFKLFFFMMNAYI